MTRLTRHSLSCRSHTPSIDSAYFEAEDEEVIDLLYSMNAHGLLEEHRDYEKIEVVTGHRESSYDFVRFFKEHPLCTIMLVNNGLDEDVDVRTLTAYPLSRLQASFKLRADRLLVLSNHIDLTLARAAASNKKEKK